MKHNWKYPQPDEIRRARKHVGLTQAEAAVVVHMQKSAWQRYETGKNKMHPAVLECFLFKMRLASIGTDGSIHISPLLNPPKKAKS